MDIGVWLALAESRTAAALFTGVKFALIVAVATIVASAIVIFAIESLETAAREFRAWLKKPRKLDGMWA
jgi:hypothetical protein